MAEEKARTEPLVSVVMPAFNAQRFIAQAVESVRAQSVTDWELIVIDDGSTDETPYMVRRLSREDPRIRLVCNGENRGTAFSRNRGLELSRGKYIALLDSDDLWRPEKLARQLALVRESGADLIYSSYGIIDESGQRCCRNYLVPESVDEKRLLRENVIGCSTVLLTRRAAARCRFSDRFYHEDYALWLRLLRQGFRLAGAAEVLADYRLHRDSRAFDKVSSARCRWQVYRGMDLSLPERGWCLACYALSGMRKYRRL